MIQWLASNPPPLPDHHTPDIDVPVTRSTGGCFIPRAVADNNMYFTYSTIYNAPSSCHSLPLESKGSVCTLTHFSSPRAKDQVSHKSKRPNVTQKQNTCLIHSRELSTLTNKDTICMYYLNRKTCFCLNSTKMQLFPAQHNCHFLPDIL